MTIFLFLISIYFFFNEKFLFISYYKNEKQRNIYFRILLYIFFLFIPVLTFNYYFFILYNIFFIFFLNNINNKYFVDIYYYYFFNFSYFRLKVVDFKIKSFLLLNNSAFKNVMKILFFILFFFSVKLFYIIYIFYNFVVFFQECFDYEKDCLSVTMGIYPFKQIKLTLKGKKKIFFYRRKQLKFNLLFYNFDDSDLIFESVDFLIDYVYVDFDVNSLFIDQYQ